MLILFSHKPYIYGEKWRDKDVKRKWSREGDMDRRRLTEHKQSPLENPLSSLSLSLFLHWGGSLESCAPVVSARPHSTERTVWLSAVPLLGERTWLQGCSWFEMVPEQTPRGHQPGRMAPLNFSFLGFLQATKLGVCEESEQEEGFHLDCSVAQQISSKLQAVITTHPVCLVPSPRLSMGPRASQPLSTVSAHNRFIKSRMSLVWK